MNALFSRLLFKTSPRAAKAAPTGTVLLEFDPNAGPLGNLILTPDTGTPRPFSGNARAGTPVVSVKAVKTLTQNANIGTAGILTSNNTTPTAGDTVTIGAKTYTFRTALTPTEGEVLIAGSADAALLNLIRAINHTGTPNTDYKCSAVHPTHHADPAVTGAHEVYVRANTRTAITDALALTETATNLSWNRSTTQARVVIGSRTYTFCQFKAANTLTSNGTNVSNGDLVYVCNKTYVFQTTLTNTDGNVKIGASAAASLTNLFNAINATGGTPGTDYALNMIANADVLATNPSSTTVLVTAIENGQAPNNFNTTKVAATLTWASAKLGGVGATFIATGGTLAGDVAISTTAALTLTNLSLAINSTGSDGLNHADLAANADWLATNPSGTTVVITAIVGGLASTNITTTETSTALSWANTTAGVNGTMASKGDMLFDSSYLYFANADLTTASLTGWRKVTHAAL